MNINQAVAFANASNPNLTDCLEIKAAKDHCACRGKCGNHTGPCMAACSKNSKTCKACADMSAGGPGSGRHPEHGKMMDKAKKAGFVNFWGNKKEKDGSTTSQMRKLTSPNVGYGRETGHVLNINTKGSFKGYTQKQWSPANLSNSWKKSGSGLGLKDLEKHLKTTNTGKLAN